MAFPVYPIVLPADTERVRDWASEQTFYDSGAFQGGTRRFKPMWTWEIPWKNINIIRQSSLQALFDATHGGGGPFLIKDAYEFRVNSVLAVRSGITNAATVGLFDTNSWFIRADTLTIGSLFSSLSGFVTLGTQYQYDQDNGVLTVSTKATNDVWGVRSAEYYRKAVFVSGAYKDRGIIWEQFNMSHTVREIV